MQVAKINNNVDLIIKDYRVSFTVLMGEDELRMNDVLVYSEKMGLYDEKDICDIAVEIIEEIVFRVKDNPYSLLDKGELNVIAIVTALARSSMCKKNESEISIITATNFVIKELDNIEIAYTKI